MAPEAERRPRPYADFGEFASGAKRGRSSDTWSTFAINRWLAFEDLATAIRMRRATLERGIGTWLPASPRAPQVDAAGSCDQASRRSSQERFGTSVNT
jgi:hypothetical protein